MKNKWKLLKWTPPFNETSFHEAIKDNLVVKG